MVKSKKDKRKEILKKFDPSLIKIALRELAIDEQRIDDKDVVKAKEQIRKIFDSFPVTKDRVKTVLRAFSEAYSEMINEDVETIKTELEDFDKAELLELDKDLIITLTPIGSEVFTPTIPLPPPRGSEIYSPVIPIPPPKPTTRSGVPHPVPIPDPRSR